MEPQSTGSDSVAATGQGNQLMECVYSNGNSMVMNITIDTQQQAILQQSLEALPCIVKQENDPSPEDSIVLLTGDASSAHLEEITGSEEALVKIAGAAETEAGVGTEGQGPTLCIIKEEQEPRKGLLREALMSCQPEEKLPAAVKMENKDDELVNVTIQTNLGESLNIQLPKHTLKGSGLEDMLPVVDSLTGDGTYQFECFLCGATFRKAAYLKAHMVVHTGDKPFKCSECSAAFATQSQLTIHTRVHTGNKPFLSVAEYKDAEGQENIQNPKPKNRYPCAHCPASFKVPSHLERHVRHKHTGEKPYKCPECEASFAKPSELKRHLRRHTGESKYTCTECPAAFKTSSALKWHVRGHFSAVKAHQCKHCPAAFRAQNDLNTHMRIHTGEKPYKCPQCPGAFAQSSTLRKHMKIHNRHAAVKRTEELAPHLIPPFLRKKKRSGQGHVCTECSARFIRPSDLVRHMRKHTGERPFACNQCSKAFTRQSDLKMHLKIHTGEKAFKCTECTLAFRSKGDLNKHMRLHTGEKPYMCADCGQMFRLLGNLKSHMAKNRHQPEDHKTEVEEPKPPMDQIYTVQIIEGPVSDHSYMCPGAVFPATQHIIIQATEAQGYGGFGVQPVSGYIPQLKQVAEVGTQVTEVGTQVVPMPEEKRQEKIVVEQGTSPPPADGTEPDCPGPVVEETLVAPPLTESGANTSLQESSDVEMTADESKTDASVTVEEAYTHKCTECKASFKKESHLNRHMLVHQGDKQHQCEDCNSAFFTKAQLTVHKRNHAANNTNDSPQNSDQQDSASNPSPKKRYKCWECNAEFAIPSHLTRHAKLKHSVDRPYQCPECPAAFRKPSYLKRHIRNHTGQNPYVCPKCPAAYTAMSSLKVHAKKAHGLDGETHSCSMCSDTFDSQDDLNKHQLLHTGEKQFKCSECPAEFAQSSHLNTHVQIHYKELPNQDNNSSSNRPTRSSGQSVFSSSNFSMTPGAKPFMCTECDATFTRSSDLKIHYRKHTGERPYLCAECPSTFARLTDLKMHNKIHTGERGFLCSECPAAFRSKGDLNKHNRIHTGEKPYMCAECGSTFRQSGSLKAHLKNHAGVEQKQRKSGATVEVKPV